MICTSTIISVNLAHTDLLPACTTFIYLGVVLCICPYKDGVSAVMPAALDLHASRPTTCMK